MALRTAEKMVVTMVFLMVERLVEQLVALKAVGKVVRLAGC